MDRKSVADCNLSFMDPRYCVLANNLVSHSTRISKGENVLLHSFGIPEDMTIALIRAVRQAGGIPFIQAQQARVDRECILGGTEEQFETTLTWELERMKAMDAYIAIRGSENVFENADLPTADLKLAMKVLKPVLDWRVKETKWCILRWPSSSMAQQAKMSSETFRDFFFDACCMNYSRMSEGMKILENLMRTTDKVEIKGPETNLKFSLDGINAVACGGTHNIPDGEVFSCPVRDSVEGVIYFNTDTIYQGTSFSNIRLRFESGRITEATSSSNEVRLNQILDSDTGARFIGEFAIAFNPMIKEPMLDILFDEKIAGSFHFTPGQAYDEASNGNQSQVHWDMVSIQRPEWGGGEIWFDGKLIRKDGLFIGSDLEKLNPEYLLSE